MATYNEKIKFIEQAAWMVRTGKANDVYEAYKILDGKYEAPDDGISFTHKFNYGVGRYRDWAYAKQIASHHDSIVKFVSKTIEYHHKKKTVMHKDFAY